MHSVQYYFYTHKQGIGNLYYSLIFFSSKLMRLISIFYTQYYRITYFGFLWNYFQFAEEEGLIYKPLDFEIFGNISAFGIFEISRLAVFEKFLRRSSYLYLHLQTLTEPPAECSSSADTDSSAFKMRSDISDVSKVILHEFDCHIMRPAILLNS